jgi:hypothetical protein
LDSNGSVLIDSSEIDNGSKGGIISLDLNQTSFSCNSVGSNAVKLTATDVNGNTDACHAGVNILDSVVPEVRCKDVTVALGADLQKAFLLDFWLLIYPFAFVAM